MESKSTDLRADLARHIALGRWADDECYWCHRQWPCDAARALTELDRLTEYGVVASQALLAEKARADTLAAQVAALVDGCKRLFTPQLDDEEWADKFDALTALVADLAPSTDAWLAAHDAALNERLRRAIDEGAALNSTLRKTAANLQMLATALDTNPDPNDAAAIRRVIALMEAEL